MRAGTGLLLLGAALAVCAGSARAEEIALEVPERVEVLRTLDVDGDGLADVVALAGREVLVWSGVKEGMPAPAPRWRRTLPGDVAFVDVARSQRPALVGLAASGPVRLRLDRDGEDAREALPHGSALGWHDPGRALFVDLHPAAPGDAACLLPTADGWAWVPASGPPVAVALAPRYAVTAAGPFLEDASTVVHGLPRPLVTRAPAGAPPGSPPVVWAIVGEELVAGWGAQRVAYDLAFVPASKNGLVALEDLDADGTPELLHGDGDNREGRYAFFRVPPLTLDARGTLAASGTDLRPPAAYLRLSGFQLDPAFVDVDGDGRRDMVITTIEIDAQNTLRAVTSGKVKALTRAFLQRVPTGPGTLFPGQPDAAVESDIGVRIRFGYAGNIDVSRSFTIVPEGDLDGDGRKDLLIRTGGAALAFRRGTAAGVWAAEAVPLAIPALAAGEELEALPADLTGDRRDDLVLHYRGATGGRDRIVVRRSP